jgi:ribosomal protein S12 methylthiotransferase accessory factor
LNICPGAKSFAGISEFASCPGAKSFASPEAPSLVFASACALNPEDAVRKGLEELEHVRYYAQRLHSKNIPKVNAGDNYENIKDQMRHVRFWSDKDNARLSDFIFGSDKYISFSEIPSLETKNDPKANLQVLLNKVSSVGHRVLLCELTTEDVANLGLYVVRSIIPGFHPLFVGHTLQALGSYRLYNVPQKLGYGGIRYGQENPAPHPFA